MLFSTFFLRSSYVKESSRICCMPLTDSRYDFAERSDSESVWVRMAEDGGTGSSTCSCIAAGALLHDLRFSRLPPYAQK